MDLDVGRTRDLFQVEARRREAAKRIERAALQQFGERAFQRDLEARVRAEAGEAALVLGVQQRHVHHRVLAAERGVLHEDAKASRAQRGDAGGDARVARDHFDRHVGQADALADDAALDVALEDFRQGLRPGFGLGVAGRHAVAHVQVADDVHGEPGDRAVTLAPVGDRADAALGIAGVELDQRAGVYRVLRVVELVQLGVQHGGGPAPVLAGREPALLRVVDVLPVRHVGTQVVMGPEVIRRQALEELAQRAGQAGQARRALAVGEQQRAVAVADVHRPDAVHRVEPGSLLDVEAQRLQSGLQRVDRGFERGVLAGDEVFGVHAAEHSLRPAQRVSMRVHETARTSL